MDKTQQVQGLGHWTGTVDNSGLHSMGKCLPPSHMVAFDVKGNGLCPLPPGHDNQVKFVHAFCIIGWKLAGDIK